MAKVLVWGTGNMARKLLQYGVNAEIAGFIQTKKIQDKMNGFKVYSPEEMPQNIDYILVANTFSDDIKRLCLLMQINIGKVIFLYRGNTTEWNDSEEIKKILGVENYTRYQAEYNILENSFFEGDKALYNSLNTRASFSIDENNLWPILSEKYADAGEAGNYFWQDMWAAKYILSLNVNKCFDIGSRLDGFIAHLLVAGVDVTMIDVREFPVEINGLTTIVDDATSLHQLEDNSIECLSALCSLEHFGLGRYGDPIDPEACFKCFRNIQRVLKSGGKLFMSLPIGRERVEFNAHRVFFPQTIIECMKDMELVEYSCTAQGLLERNVDIHKYDDDLHDGNYRYGLFYFIKK